MGEHKFGISILVGGRLKEIRRISRGEDTLELVFADLPNHGEDGKNELVLVIADSEGYMPSYTVKDEEHE